jgi:NAD(P)H-dependent flavin oxidoreductase YrpB (nitropropane dioxygenase family)
MARPVLHTPLCDLLKVEYPVILAGMGGGNDGGFALAELVAAVSEAGGLGVLGAATLNADQIHDQCAKIRSLTKKPFGVDVLLPAEPAGDAETGDDASAAQIDQKYWDWTDEAIARLGLAQPGPPQGEDAPYSRREHQDRQVEAVLHEKVPVLAVGLGSARRYVQALHEAGVLLINLVGNVRNAHSVSNDGADIIVAQGHEAGGHTGYVGTFALTPQVVDAVAPKPVVVAGGVGDGRGLAAALALGAQGVWVGTAFLATHEANVLPDHKQRFLAMTDDTTRITRFYTGKTLRHPRNELTEHWEASGLPALPLGTQGRVARRVQDAARDAGRTDVLYQPAGQIVGLVKEIRPARVVLEEMVQGAVDVLSHLSRAPMTVVP